MAELIDLANAMFKNRRDWVKITDEDKEKFFFIFNRYFSKKYPENAQLLNLKTVNKSVALGIWYHFMSDKGYPNWFWSKSPKKELELPEKDYNLLINKLKIKNIDLDYLISNYKDFIKEELKYYKQLEKQ